MKRRNYFFLFTILLSVFGYNAFAHDFVVNGIYYSYRNGASGNAVYVTYNRSGSSYQYGVYSGNFVLPATVSYNGRTYKVTGIGSYAFKNCYNLTSITIPSSVTSIDVNEAFYGCSRLGSIIVESGNTSYDSRDNCNAIIKTSTNELILGCKNTIIPSSVTSIGSWAFSGNTSIVSINIPNTITEIDYNAFYGCSSLTSVQITDMEAWCKINFYNEGSNPLGYAHHLFLNDVEISNLVIPNGVTSIGAYAFYGGNNINSVSIPNSVTSIGANAFSGTTWFDNQPDGVVYVGKIAYLYKGTMPENTAITINSGTLGIAGSAFKNCNNLASVSIPNSVTTIGASAFYGCSSLTSVNLPSNLTYLGPSAFYGCSKITSIVIPSGITGINNYSFYGCRSLKSITIGSNVLTIGSDAFEDCSSLSSIVIPNSVTEINWAAFKGCSSLTSLTIGNGLTTIGYHGFENCSNLNKIIIGKGLESVSSDAFKGCNAISTLEYHCKSANGSWFNCKESLSKLIIGDEVETVGGFNGCTNLTSVDVGNGLETIGYSAFQGCSSLVSITIGNGVEYIGSQAFQNCSSLSYISIPNGVKTLGGAAFGGCSNLATVSIGSGLETIYGGTFGSCDKLVSIVVDENNPKYDSRNNCNAIIEKETNKLIVGCKGTTIPNSVTCIGNYSFQACNGLTTIIIPQGVTTIENDTFYGCSDLANVSVPNSVTAVGNNAFYGTPWFNNQPDGLIYVGRVAYKYKGTIPDGTTINIKDGTVGITGYAFDGCSGLVSVTIPNSLTNIGSNTFAGCSGLTSIDIPEGVTSIGQYAFSNCSGLTSIDIPEGVTSIGSFTFEGCSSLSSITFPGSLKTLGGYLFGYNGGCTSLTSITVREGVEKINTIFKNLKKATITLPNSVTTIDSFEGCQNCTVTIGTGIQQLNNAFSYTNDMTIYIHAFKRPQTSYHCFYMSRNCKSYVPYGRGEAYRSGSNLEGGSFWCSVSEMPYPALTIGSSGYATYCSNKALDFSEVEDVKAYVATDFIASSNTLILTRVMKTPAGEGIIVVGKPGTYDIPECTTDITYNNLLNGMSYPDYVEPTDGDYTNFLFTGSNTELSFKPMEDVTPFFAGTAYLHLPSDCLPTDAQIVNVHFQETECTDISQMDNVIYIEPMEARTGTQATISLKMKNTAPIRAFQFDLYLPEGVTAVKSAKGRIQGFLSAGRLPDEDEHTLSFSEQPDGAIRFLCGSEYDETFTGNDGEIATLLVNIADNIVDGDYPIQLKGMKLTETDISKYYETALVKSKLTISSYVVGDINSDGVVDVSDYTGVANHIHNNTPAGFNAKAADVDESGGIDVSDYTGIANIIHTGSIYGNNSNARMMVRGPRKVNTDLSSKDNVIYVKPLAALAGSQATISVKMKNTAEIRSFQFDLQLPDGVTVVKSAKGKIQGSLSASRLPEEDEHTLSFSEHEGNVIRFLCGSLSDETFTGNDGEIATLLVDVAANVEAEDHTVYLRNMKLSESDIRKFYQTEELGTTLAVAPEGSARGDANGDKSVSVTDIAVVVNEILQITNTGGFMMYGADANGDGDITVTDIGVIVDKILGTKTSANSRKMEQEVEPQ